MATIRRIGRRDDDEPRRIGFKAHAEPEPALEEEPPEGESELEQDRRGWLINGEPERTRQLAEWLGLLIACVALGGLFGWLWGLLALGLAIVVSANAS